MRKYYEAMLDHFRELHAEALKGVDVLPPEALDWVPGPEMNSLSVLIMHFSGSERYWIGDVVKGDPSFRNREAEFETKGLYAAALKQRIADLDAYEAAVFDKLRLRDLDTWKVSPRDGRKVTIAYALLHAMWHTSVHLGHIEILVQQWKQKQAG
ncbi:MAG: DUF1572 family protein [Chloroflexota bacterium]